MASTSGSLFNMTTVHSNTTTKPHNFAGFCPPFPKGAFETLDSSIPYFAGASLNASLAIATTFANLLVLLAMRHVTSIRFPSKILLCSLLLTDLGVGLVVQPQFAVSIFLKAIHPQSVHRCSLFSSFAFTGSLFFCISLFTMTAISLDRYAALFFYLRYQQIVTTRRVCAVLTFIWSFSLVFASAGLRKSAFLTVIFATVLLISLLIISVAYIKIYRRLLGQHGQQVQPQPQANEQAQQQAENTLNMEKYKRTASKMMWIYVLFVICYLSFLSGNLIFVSVVGYTALITCILDFCYTVLLLNSCLNPFVYCLRLPEIRTEVMKQLRQFCCRIP